jgi:hypothetical protein
MPVKESLTEKSYITSLAIRTNNSPITGDTKIGKCKVK